MINIAELNQLETKANEYKKLKEAFDELPQMHAELEKQRYEEGLQQQITSLSDKFENDLNSFQDKKKSNDRQLSEALINLVNVVVERVKLRDQTNDLYNLAKHLAKSDLEFRGQLNDVNVTIGRDMINGLAEQKIIDQIGRSRLMSIKTSSRNGTLQSELWHFLLTAISEYSSDTIVCIDCHVDGSVMKEANHQGKYQ